MADGFTFLLERCEDRRGDVHETLLHGRASGSPPAPGTPLRIPARDGPPLLARLARVDGPDRLVVHEPAVLRELVGAGNVEPCGEDAYARGIVGMLDDDRVRNLFHDRLYPPGDRRPDAFAPPACACIEVLRGRPEAIPALRAMLRSWEPENVSGAAQALALFGPEACVPHLVRLLRHNVARVRYRAARLLAAHTDAPGVTEALEGLARDPDPRVRRLASA